MMNQEAFEAARAGDWVAETFNRSGDVFYVGGSSTGYSTFGDALDDGASVFYAAFDENDNREAGLAVWSKGSNTLTPVEVHATLVGGAFIKGDPEPLNFPSGGTIVSTLNATAFNTIWRHVFERGNPHGTTAGEIEAGIDGDASVADILRIIIGDLNDHVSSNSNPHNVSAAQVSQLNDQNGLGQNVQNALNRLNQNLVEHEGAPGNVHGVMAGDIHLYPEIELADGDTVQDALDTIYDQFKSSEVYPEYLHLNEVTGDETLIRVRRIDADDVANFHHGHDDIPAVESIDDANVGELMWEAEGGGLYGVKVGGIVVQIGGEGVLLDAPEDGLVYARKDGDWFEVTPTLVQDERPEDPAVGSLWLDTGTTAELYAWDGLQWISVTGGNAGGEGEITADNNTADNIPAELEDKGLVRTIDASGAGVWRQPTTADIVTIGDEPVFAGADTFSADDGSEVLNQQQANWYLFNQITGGSGQGGIFVKKTGDTMTGILRYKGKDSEHGTFKIQPEVPDDWDSSTYFGVQIDLAKGTTFRNRFTVSTVNGRAFEINGNGESNYVIHTPRMPETDVVSATSDKELSYGVNVKTAKDNFIGNWEAAHYADEDWRLKCNMNGADWTMIGFDKANNCLGLYHLPDEPRESHHATSKKYVLDQIKVSFDALEAQIDNSSGNFMPIGGGDFTGEVKYGNVNHNSGAPTTLMHKAAFDSVLSNFEMGDRRYHGIFINRALQANKTPITIKSSSSNTNISDFKVINNSSYNTIQMFGQTGGIECGRSSSPFVATKDNEVTTLKCVNDLIASGGDQIKAANKIFQYTSTGSSTGPVHGGFTFNDGRMKVAHTEKINGGNFQWNAATKMYDEMDATGVYTVYELFSGGQRLVEMGTYQKVKIGVNSTQGSFRSTEFVCNRKVQQKSLVDGNEYALVIGGFF